MELGTVSDPAVFSKPGDEAWLRHLLVVCHRTLDDLRKTDGLDVRSLITDLERVRAKVQRQLDSPRSRGVGAL